MTTVETIPKATVWAALEALGIPAGEPFNRTMVVHITGDHISYEQADGQTILWRRVVDECPSCHASQGQPHTDYCQDRRHGCEDPSCQRCPDCNELRCRCRPEESREYPGQPGDRLELPAYWADREGIKIHDPDGWDRRNFAQSWNTPITLDEFNRRASISTTSKR